MNLHFLVPDASEGSTYSTLVDNGLYQGDLNLFVGHNEYIGLWNEPTAHWTKPNDFGYYKPNQLAALAHAAIGNTEITTDIGSSGVTTPVGIKNVDPNMKIISPDPHEMDVNYYLSFMASLRALRPEEEGEVLM